MSKQLTKTEIEELKTIFALDSSSKTGLVIRSSGVPAGPAWCCKKENRYWFFRKLNRCYADAARLLGIDNPPVHQIVAILKYGKNIPEGYHVDHINGNTLDNSVDNIRVITHAENVAHTFVTKVVKSNGGYKVTWPDGESTVFNSIHLAFNFRGIKNRELMNLGGMAA